MDIAREKNEDMDGITSKHYTTAPKFPPENGIPEWISGSKCHLLSLTKENISKSELRKSNLSLTQISSKEIKDDIKTSDAELSWEMNVHEFDEFEFDEFDEFDREDNTGNDNSDKSKTYYICILDAIEYNEISYGSNAALDGDDSSCHGIGSSIFTRPMEPVPKEPEKKLSIKVAFLLLFVIFIVCLVLLIFVYMSFPKMDESEAKAIKFPSDIDDAKHLGQVLLHYKKRYLFEVMGGLAVTYLFLQTFAIPGSIFLSIVLGYLFSFPVALGIICLCSASGASFCYLLSYLVGRPLVKRYLPHRAAAWSAKVQAHEQSLLSYIIFLRITPFLPNWFINVVSPIIGVPLIPFYFGTVIGVAPPSFVCIQAGTTLQQLTSSTDALTFESVALLVIFAILSLLPGIYRNRLSIKNNIKKSKACVEKCCCHTHGDNIDAGETATQKSEAESTGCRATNEDAIDPCQRTNT